MAVSKEENRGRLRWEVVTRFQRALAAAFSAGSVIVVVLARWTTPDPRGLGTHEQLGLAPCSMLTFFHIPCPFCGMTTTFSLMVRGEFWNAIIAQPAGALLFVLLPFTFISALVVAVAGRAPLRALGGRGLKPLLIMGFTTVFLAWTYKIFWYIS